MKTGSQDTPWHSDWESTLMDMSEHAMEVDIKGTDELKMTSRLNKTEEEIKKYTVDESLNEIDRAVLLLRTGATVQKCAVINSLLRLAQEYTADFRHKVLPVVTEDLLKDPSQLQVTKAKAIASLVDSGLLQVKSLQHITSTGRKLLDTAQEDAVAAWAEVVLVGVRNLPPDIIEADILPSALADSGLAQPPPLRVWCCRVLGAAATRMEARRVRDVFLRRAIALCQDTDWEVRACMCNQLPALAACLGPVMTRAELVEELAELLVDEERSVLEAAIVAMGAMLDYVDSDTRRDQFIPMWKKLCESSTGSTVVPLAHQFGVLFWKTRGELSDDDIAYFVRYFVHLSQSEMDEHRSECAYNLPAVVQAIGINGFEMYGLETIIEDLAEDACADVRKRIAAGIKEVAIILGDRAYTWLRSPVTSMMAETDVTVLSAVVKSLDTTLEQFSFDDDAKRSTTYDELLYAILRRERDCATHQKWGWRLHLNLLQQMRNFSEYFESDLVHDHCVPVLVKLLTENVVIPVKEQALENLCIYMRKLRRQEHRDRISRLLNDLVMGHSFHEHFFQNFLDMSHDPVANIRLRMVALLPIVRRGLKLPQESTALQRLNEAVGDLLTHDGDRDVERAMTELIGKLNSSPDGAEPGAGFLGTRVLSTNSQDQLDRQREEEEERVRSAEHGGGSEDSGAGNSNRPRILSDVKKNSISVPSIKQPTKSVAPKRKTSLQSQAPPLLKSAGPMLPATTSLASRTSSLSPLIPVAIIPPPTSGRRGSLVNTTSTNSSANSGSTLNAFKQRPVSRGHSMGLSPDDDYDEPTTSKLRPVSASASNSLPRNLRKKSSACNLDDSNDTIGSSRGDVTTSTHLVPSTVNNSKRRETRGSSSDKLSNVVLKAGSGSGGGSGTSLTTSTHNVVKILSSKHSATSSGKKY
ncbi:hypothetical protein SeMB42_g07189 [Synchytrium endobioticum]|uniref:Condensin complex subunit 1 C-terminal domain-containing protein n=1 Tax=Synchytrium endobioticum TaxID=286115 RepID=A0A507CBR8_9FUNG|nr:hypothetical protein SeMB42_g07189 [Synchytrium endobioticum]TPX40196.1 hypothetical protein SeLEV6574_g06741 [Synchytrium endobioticum]